MNRIKELINLIKLEKPQKSEAVVWLQGDRYDRGIKVLNLYKKDWVKKIILSGNNKLIGEKARPGENNITLSEMRDWLLDHKVKRKDIIIDDKSLNTREQVNNVLKLAEKKGWYSIIIVGSWPYYQFRAFLTFLKAAQQLKWHGRIINQFVTISLNKRPSGRKETANNLLLKEIDKLKKYRDDVATIEEGVEYLKKSQEKLLFRKARLDDAKLLLKWRNDPKVRANSFNQNKIKFTDHVIWLNKILKDPSHFLFLVYNRQGQAVGEVRFDIKKKFAEINLLVASKYRGLGYGSKIISGVSTFFLQKNSDIKYILARIKKQNKASIYAFLKSGYKYKNIKDGVVFMNYYR